LSAVSFDVGSHVSDKGLDFTSVRLSANFAKRP
jgi:hypothetical protein